MSFIKALIFVFITWSLFNGSRKESTCRPLLFQIRSEKWWHAPILSAARRRQGGNESHSDINRKYLIFHAAESLNKGFTMSFPLKQRDCRQVFVHSFYAIKMSYFLNRKINDGVVFTFLLYVWDFCQKKFTRRKESWNFFKKSGSSVCWLNIFHVCTTNCRKMLAIYYASCVIWEINLLSKWISSFMPPLIESVQTCYGRKLSLHDFYGSQ